MSYTFQTVESSIFSDINDSTFSSKIQINFGGGFQLVFLSLLDVTYYFIYLKKIDIPRIRKSVH